jgi:CRP-like cAMP-binding protein
VLQLNWPPPKTWKAVSLLSVLLLAAATPGSSPVLGPPASMSVRDWLAETPPQVQHLSRARAGTDKIVPQAASPTKRGAWQFFMTPAPTGQRCHAALCALADSQPALPAAHWPHCERQASRLPCRRCCTTRENPSMAETENALIHQLPKPERKRLLERCESFELVLSEELSMRGQPLSHAHFPRTGFISLVIDVDTHPALEVGMAGRESMLGAELALGLAKTPWRALVQGPGLSWRIEAETLRQECLASPALQRVMQTSLLVRLHQQALAAACERFHMLGPRLARWLLMSQDRSQTNSFHVTQKCMALLLGVRRVGVTEAASEFQKNGLIRYHRGEVTVLNRLALEARACSCYAADRQIHAELSEGLAH